MHEGLGLKDQTKTIEMEDPCKNAGCFMSHIASLGEQGVSLGGAPSVIHLHRSSALTVCHSPAGSLV